jgi:hypothetical protein
MSSVNWHVFSAYSDGGTVLSASLVTEDGNWEAYLKSDGCFDLSEAGGHEDAFSIHLCDGLASLDELILRLQNLRASAIMELGVSSDEWTPATSPE